MELYPHHPPTNCKGLHCVCSASLWRCNPMRPYSYSYLPYKRMMLLRSAIIYRWTCLFVSFEESKTNPLHVSWSGLHLLCNTICVSLLKQFFPFFQHLLQVVRSIQACWHAIARSCTEACCHSCWVREGVLEQGESLTTNLYTKMLLKKVLHQPDLQMGAMEAEPKLTISMVYWTGT